MKKNYLKYTSYCIAKKFCSSLGFYIVGLSSLGYFAKLLKNPPKHETSKKSLVTEGVEQGRIIKRLVTNAHFRHFLSSPFLLYAE